jgi:hypothetical protein
LHEQSLCSLDPVEGAEVGVFLPDDLSPGMGLAREIVLRKSVYAMGGVMGVLMPSSCFMKSAKPGRGLRADREESSEGKVEDIGVCSWGSLGFVEGIVSGQGTEDPIARADSAHQGPTSKSAMTGGSP